MLEMCRWYNSDSSLQRLLNNVMEQSNKTELDLNRNKTAKTMISNKVKNTKGYG